MQLTIPESTLVKKAEYVGEVLTLEFTRGGTYQYDSVPAFLVAAMTMTDSVGSFFQRFIKHRFPYRKISE
jgi:hypothetical protein